ncbi:Putative ATP-binding cassette sub-family C member 13 [Tupaia chinensis]|uniref:Putative ATP-binding cassette sub-family C member 13 n=1 Tax=Tupaia chinensis TaxID=246437 RepID=L9KHR3_TUPCH|nr:Putative ATP-binding cassette sub-family C member 13 [Tupaia chinensis]
MFSSLWRWGASGSYERIPGGINAQKHRHPSILHLLYSGTACHRNKATKETKKAPAFPRGVCIPEEERFVLQFCNKIKLESGKTTNQPCYPALGSLDQLDCVWIGIIILGYKKPLEREDLFELNESDSSYNVCPIFEKQWRKEVFRNQERQKIKESFHKETSIRKPSLLCALWNTFKSVLIQVALFKVFADILSFTSPLIMKQMINFCEHSSDSGWSGYGYAVALFAVVFLQTLILQQYQRFNMLTSAKIKTALIGLIYKKALLLANVSREKFSTGEIINLMSADAQQLMDLTANLNLLWSAPFQILMALLLLWQELGPAVLAGVAVLMFVIPINVVVATRVKKLKVSLVTFGIYSLLDEGNILTATKAFTSLSLFNILRIPLFDLPMVISSVVQTRISLGRLEDFLNTEELRPQNIETNYTGDHAIGFTNASFSWNKTGIPLLKDLNIKIPEGALVAVVGQVGSGKSSVLSAILGEMEKLTGVVQRKGVNISGGQKHRVSLARAVYSGADIYLLDDPLAAVDVHVGKQLFEKVIGSSGLLKNKTRVLVTHNLTVLPQTDLIVVMESGRAAQVGTYQELLSKTENLTNLFQVFSDQEKALDGLLCRQSYPDPSPIPLQTTAVNQP